MYERFEELRKLFGVTVAQICAETGINKSTMSEWKNGKFQLKDSKRKLLANFFGVPLSVLDGEEPIPETLVALAKESGKYHSASWQGRELHPVYDVAAGQGRINDGYPDEYMCEESDTHSWCRICGDSMYPVLHDGDYVRIEHTTETEPTDLTAIRIDGEACTIKHVEVCDNGIWVRAVNKAVYEDKFYSMREVLSLPIAIIGKAVEMRRKF